MFYPELASLSIKIRSWPAYKLLCGQETCCNLTMTTRLQKVRTCNASKTTTYMALLAVCTFFLRVSAHLHQFIDLFICVIHSEILHSWKFSFCDHVFCQGLFISRLGIHVSMYDWLPLGFSLLWQWRGLSEDLSTHRARAVCLPHCSQQSSGPKTAAGETPASSGPSHYTPEPL